MSKNVTISLSKKRIEILEKLMKSNNLGSLREAIYYALENLTSIPLSDEELIKKYAPIRTTPLDVTTVPIKLRDKTDGTVQTFKTTAYTLEEAKELYSPYLSFADIIEFNGEAVSED